MAAERSTETCSSGDSVRAALSGRRVGFLIDRWEPARGGGEAALFALAERLAEAGAELAILAEHADEAALPTGAEWHRVRARGLTRTRREAHLARALVESAKALALDVSIGTRHLSEVDLFWPHGGSYRASLGARRESRGRELEASPRGRHALFLELERELLAEGGARRVVCVSELVERELAREYPACAARLVTIPNGVDLERFHPRERLEPHGAGQRLRAELGLPAGRALLLFSAREPRLKGLPQLLEALGSLAARDLHLLVAGLRRPEAWRKQARRLGLGERTSFVAEGDPVALSAAADLCVLPTWRDTSSLVVLECLASGTPVVTTARAGAASWIGDAYAGAVLAEPGDVDALRAELERRLLHFETASGATRERVRESVRACDRESWLAALVAEVVALAP